MGRYVARKLVKAMTNAADPRAGARVLIMGLTFKENCPDLRNTKVVDIVAELREYGVQVDVYDPWVRREDAQHEYGIKLDPIEQSRQGCLRRRSWPSRTASSVLGAEAMRVFGKPEHVLYDLKYLLPPEASDCVFKQVWNATHIARNAITT